MRGKMGIVVVITAICVVLGMLAGAAAAPQKGKAASKKENFGKGEVEIAEDLAKKSGKTTDEIMTMRKSGKGWGEIAKELGVKVGPAVSEAKKEKPKKGKAPGKSKAKKAKSKPKKGKDQD